MYDHDYNFFGGGGDDPVADVASGARGARDDNEADLSIVVKTADGNSKHRDPFHVRCTHR